VQFVDDARALINGENFHRGALFSIKSFYSLKNIYNITKMTALLQYLVG
jgi:hypothetical protein